MRYEASVGSELFGNGLGRLQCTVQESPAPPPPRPPAHCAIRCCAPFIQRDNFLNTIGDGMILLWKRRAERYLIDSGLNYTIIHPGGLIDEQVWVLPCC